MAAYYEHFKRSKDKIIDIMMHAGDVTNEMEKERIITFDERAGIHHMGDRTLKRKRILELIETKSEFKKFIQILEKTKNEECVLYLKGYQEETAATPREELLQSKLNSALDEIKTQKKKIVELVRQKGRVERKANQLDSALKLSREHTTAYIKLESELKAAHKEISDLEEQILSLKNSFGIEIDNLEGKLDEQNQKIDTLTENSEEMKKTIGETNSILHFVTEQMEKNQREMVKMMSQHNINEENGSDFEGTKSVNPLAPIKKR